MERGADLVSFRRGFSSSAVNIRCSYLIKVSQASGAVSGKEHQLEDFPGGPSG